MTKVLGVKDADLFKIAEQVFKMYYVCWSQGYETLEMWEIIEDLAETFPELKQKYSDFWKEPEQNE